MMLFLFVKSASFRYFILAELPTHIQSPEETIFSNYYEAIPPRKYLVQYIFIELSNNLITFPKSADKGLYIEMLLN